MGDRVASRPRIASGDVRPQRRGTTFRSRIIGRSLVVSRSSISPRLIGSRFGQSGLTAHSLRASRRGDRFGRRPAGSLVAEQRQRAVVTERERQRLVRHCAYPSFAQQQLRQTGPRDVVQESPNPGSGASVSQILRRVLSAVRNRGNLAAKSACQHGCKRENAALTAMPQRTRPSAASRVCCAGLAPALDPAPGRQFSCPIFWRRQISAVLGRC